MTLIDDRYEKLDSKSVLDSDGFMTDYTLYYDYEDDVYFCMFGDNEIYTPDINYADFETENEEEAWDFFDDYNGIYDEYDDIEECSSVEAASEEGNGYDDYVEELSIYLRKNCLRHRAYVRVVSDEIETTANEYEDLSSHYIELKPTVAGLRDVVKDLDDVRSKLTSLGESLQVVESSETISAADDLDDFNSTSLEEDLHTVKDDLMYIYNRLGRLQDKWFDTDEVYVINQAAVDVGDAITVVNKAIRQL